MIETNMIKQDVITFNFLYLLLEKNGKNPEF